jgi:hypothetical protein
MPCTLDNKLWVTQPASRNTIWTGFTNTVDFVSEILPSSCTKVNLFFLTLSIYLFRELWGVFEMLKQLGKALGFLKYPEGIFETLNLTGKKVEVHELLPSAPC